MPKAFLVSACRTPLGKFQGALSSLRAPELGALALREVLGRAGLGGEHVDEVIMGNVLQAGVGQNPARQAMRFAQLPDSIPPFTVNKVCGSGLKAVMLAAQSIKAGDNQVVLAGGMESMSQSPYLVPAARSGARLGHAELVDAMVHDGLWDVYSDQHMGMTGELVANHFQITREMQDDFAAQSHQKVAKAWQNGSFEEETFDVSVPQRKGEDLVVRQDEGFRENASADGFAKLRPAFTKDGSVTAANASQISDGASAVLVASEVALEKHGLTPMAEITGYAAGGLAPEWVMIAPQKAMENLASVTGFAAQEFDLLEVNEAFAAAACALTQELKLDPSRVNVHGGAIALGHPIGASGARILTTLLYAMKRQGASNGAATLCLGGGNAVALAVKSC